MAAATLLGVAATIYLLLNRARTSVAATRLVALGTACALASLPFQFAEHQYFVRGVLSTIAVSQSVKAVEFMRGRLSDNSVASRFGRFLLWLWIPHDLVWPVDARAAKNNRQRGMRRFARTAAKAAAFVALHYAAQALRISDRPYFVGCAVTAVQFYLFMTGIADALSSAVMLCGIKADELFNAPFISRSPAEFWSRRWNLYIARFAARHVFIPLGGTARKGLATVLVFTASALMHEYLVLAIFGFAGARLGYMSLFFAVHGVAVLSYHASMRRKFRQLRLPVPLGIALHSLWFFPTTGWFFTPIGPLLETWGIAWHAVPWP